MFKILEHLSYLAKTEHFMLLLAYYPACKECRLTFVSDYDRDETVINKDSTVNFHHLNNVLVVDIQNFFATLLVILLIDCQPYILTGLEFYFG